MSGLNISPQQLKAFLDPVVPDDTVVWVKDNAATIARRGFCERVVYFFRGEKPGDLQRLEDGLRAAFAKKQCFNETVAANAFANIRPDARKSITVRQLREAVVHGRREAINTQVQKFMGQVQQDIRPSAAPVSGPGRIHVDDALPATRQQLYRLMLLQQMTSAPDKYVAPWSDKSPEWAIETLEHVKALSEEGVQTAQMLMEQAVNQAQYLIRALGNDTRPETLLKSLMDLEVLSSQLSKATGQKLENGLALVQERISAAMSPHQAWELYHSLMAEGGRGQALLSGLAAVAAEQEPNQNHLSSSAMRSAQENLQPPPAQRLLATLQRILTCLAEHGGLDAGRPVTDAGMGHMRAANRITNDIRIYLSNHARQVFADWQKQGEPSSKNRVAEWLREGYALAQALSPRFKSVAEKRVSDIAQKSVEARRSVLESYIDAMNKDMDGTFPFLYEISREFTKLKYNSPESIHSALDAIDRLPILESDTRWLRQITSDVKYIRHIIEPLQEDQAEGIRSQLKTHMEALEELDKDQYKDIDERMNAADREERKRQVAEAVQSLRVHTEGLASSLLSSQGVATDSPSLIPQGAGGNRDSIRNDLERIQDQIRQQLPAAYQTSPLLLRIQSQLVDLQSLEGTEEVDPGGQVGLPTKAKEMVAALEAEVKLVIGIATRLDDVVRQVGRLEKWHLPLSAAFGLSLANATERQLTTAEDAKVLSGEVDELADAVGTAWRSVAEIKRERYLERRTILAQDLEKVDGIKKRIAPTPKVEQALKDFDKARDEYDTEATRPPDPSSDEDPEDVLRIKLGNLTILLGEVIAAAADQDSWLAPPLR